MNCIPTTEIESPRRLSRIATSRKPRSQSPGMAPAGALFMFSRTNVRRVEFASKLATMAAATGKMQTSDLGGTDDAGGHGGFFRAATAKEDHSRAGARQSQGTGKQGRAEPNYLRVFRGSARVSVRTDGAVLYRCAD